MSRIAGGFCAASRTVKWDPLLAAYTKFRGTNDIVSMRSVVPTFVTLPLPSLKLYLKLSGCMLESADVTLFATDPGYKKLRYQHVQGNPRTCCASGIQELSSSNAQLLTSLCKYLENHSPKPVNPGSGNDSRPPSHLSGDHLQLDPISSVGFLDHNRITHLRREVVGSASATDSKSDLAVRIDVDHGLAVFDRTV